MRAAGIDSKEIVACRSLPSWLGGVENTLAQEWKTGSPIAHPLDQLELVHFALDDPLTGRQGEASFDGLFVSEYSTDERLQFADLAFLDTPNPLIEVLAFPV
jgi:hypothetical protein